MHGSASCARVPQIPGWLALTPHAHERCESFSKGMRQKVALAGAHVATNAPLAAEALQRIGQLFDIERVAIGLSPEQRRRIRQNTERPVIDDLAVFFDAALSNSPA